MIVCSAIVVKRNKILLARRANGHSLSGYWEFPGGKKSQDETIFECVTREFYEELFWSSRTGHIHLRQFIVNRRQAAIGSV